MSRNYCRNFLARYSVTGMAHGGPRSRTAVTLIDAIGRLLGPACELRRAYEREWASATFHGARHLLDYACPAVPDAALARVLASLPDHDFGLRGEIVADCTVASGNGASDMPESDAGGGRWRPVRIELLTINAD